MSEWESAGSRAIRTAFELLNEQDEHDEHEQRDDEPTMSG
jgi:hypothetical protein